MLHFRTFVGTALLATLVLPTLAAAECKVQHLGTLPVEVVGERATVTASVNGKSASFMLDTGATFGSMARANVEALGLKRESAPPGMHAMAGIGGSVQAEMTRVKNLGLLGSTLNDIEFLVGGSDMGMGLIGANLLDAVDADIDLANGKLQLLKPSGCGNLSMAYWVKDGQYNVADLHRTDKDYDRRSFVDVKVNGKTVRALLDSGAQATLMSRRAAERVGLNLAVNVGSGLSSGGVGTHRFKVWVVPIDSYSIGTEQIQHSKIAVLDGDLGEGSDAPDMLLGIDFFLAHHIFVANSQRRVYFTYNGGRMFTMANARPADTATEHPADKPMTAAELALRGQAHVSRGEVALATADFDAAIGLAPDQAAYRMMRARTRVAEHKLDDAMDDLGAAIRLDNRNVDALLLRARIRYARKDKDAAQQDVEAARALAPAGSLQARELASFFVAMERPKEALPLLDDWIRLHPEDGNLPDVLNERCWARGLANEQLDGALGDCNKAIRAAKKGAYYESLGLIQLRLGHNGEAQASYEKAVAMMPRSAWSHFCLGLAHLRQGQKAQGDAEIVAAKAINPGIEAHLAIFGIVLQG